MELSACSRAAVRLAHTPSLAPAVTESVQRGEVGSRRSPALAVRAAAIGPRCPRPAHAASMTLPPPGARPPALSGDHKRTPARIFEFGLGAPAPLQGPSPRRSGLGPVDSPRGLAPWPRRRGFLWPRPPVASRATRRGGGRRRADAEGDLGSRAAPHHGAGQGGRRAAPGRRPVRVPWHWGGRWDGAGGRRRRRPQGRGRRRGQRAAEPPTEALHQSPAAHARRAPGAAAPPRPWGGAIPGGKELLKGLRPGRGHAGRARGHARGPQGGAAGGA